MESPSPRPRRRAMRRGFTLIETATAMIIISVAVVAMCGLLAAGTNANISGNEMTTAVNLAGTIHEIAVGLPLSDGGKPVIGPYRCVRWDLKWVVIFSANRWRQDSNFRIRRMDAASDRSDGR